PKPPRVLAESRAAHGLGHGRLGRGVVRGPPRQDGRGAQPAPARGLHSARVVITGARLRRGRQRGARASVVKDWPLSCRSLRWGGGESMILKRNGFIWLAAAVLLVALIQLTPAAA